MKCLRALDRPIAHEGGTAVLRPCVGHRDACPSTAPIPRELLMAADVARRIAGTREEGYHVFQSEDSVEAEVYHGLDIDLAARDPRQRARGALPAAGRARRRAARSAPRRCCAGGIPPRAPIPPATIVGIAENTGIIGSLTFWVLNAVLR